MKLTTHDSPWRHFVADGLFPALLLRACYDCVPGPKWGGWDEPGKGARYDNPLERGKRTTRDVDSRPGWKELFARLQSPWFVDWLGLLAGIDGLQPDPHLWGAGVHVTDAGGELSAHLDYSRCPHLPDMERRLNLVLFLNPAWDELHGGALELCDDFGVPAKRIYPHFGRAVLWMPGEIEYHATETVATDAPPRVTAAVYFIAPARASSVRKRALFCPRRP